MRGYRMGLGSWLGAFLVTLGLVVPACGGSSDGDKEKEKENDLDDCLACADAECPTQSAACDASPTCQTLRSCQLACSAGDTACRNQCTSAAAGDANGIVAAGNLIACASMACQGSCPFASTSPNASGGSGGRAQGTGGGAAKGGTVGATGGAGTGGFVTTGTGGSSGPPPICQDLLEWATGCAVDRESVFRSCDATPISQCKASCYLDARCADYDEVKAGTANVLSNCLTSCDLTFGGGKPAPTCDNAAGKRFSCGITTIFECDDASALDTCFNQCTLDYDCGVINAAFLENKENDFVFCYDRCEAEGGGQNPNFIVDEGGYVTAGDWHGYAWTDSSGAPSTIAPSDFSAVPAGGQLCVSGTVAGSSDYSGYAMLGLSLAQEAGDPAPEPTWWNPTGQGIEYNITNRTAAPLRIQIQAIGGDTDPTQRWCADVVGQSGNIFWHTFNTECWEGGVGVAYDGGTSLVSVSVLVPGDLAARPFDFCVYELGSD
jgi:hypothetical protein